MIVSGSDITASGSSSSCGDFLMTTSCGNCIDEDSEKE